MSTFWVVYGEHGWPHDHWKYVELMNLLGLACALEGADGQRIIGNVLNSMCLHALNGGRGRITIITNTETSMHYGIPCISVVVVVLWGAHADPEPLRMQQEL